MKEYTVTTDSGETTVLLSDEDAKARGLKPVEPKAKSAKPVNKEATPANKAATPADKRADAASRSFGNKPK